MADSPVARPEITMIVHEHHEAGLRTANCGDGCGDGSKISKRPFDKRVAWVDENIEKIKGSAASPLEQRWWTEADKPFQFLAACFELASALEQGPTFVSRLPVSFDGSCVAYST